MLSLAVLSHHIKTLLIGLYYQSFKTFFFLKNVKNFNWLKLCGNNIYNYL